MHHHLHPSQKISPFSFRQPCHHIFVLYLNSKQYANLKNAYVNLWLTTRLRRYDIIVA
jgi:hypothetical protein